MGPLHCTICTTDLDCWATTRRDNLKTKHELGLESKLGTTYRHLGIFDWFHGQIIIGIIGSFNVANAINETRGERSETRGGRPQCHGLTTPLSSNEAILTLSCNSIHKTAKEV